MGQSHRVKRGTLMAAACICLMSLRAAIETAEGCRRIRANSYHGSFVTGGLEEGAAVRNRWAVDYDEEAIHANLRDLTETALYFGSVNDLLAHAIQGKSSCHVPAPGEVDFVSAGSPCQGFSAINSRKNSEHSLRNCSLVASLSAYVDFYRPKYALLENVVTMASTGEKGQDQNVFSQTICCLVGMGYQVPQFNLDAWSFGSPQSRSRLFLSIATPGLPLPPHPGLSHSHPANKGD